MRTCNLFISHSWNYSDTYDRLVDLLDSRTYFTYRDYSIPQDNPVHAGTDQELMVAIKEKIRHCHVVLIVAGVYSTYSKWIDIEMEVSSNWGKPIIAIEPWGSERTSQPVKEKADEIFGWNTSNIVDAIRRNWYKSLK